MIMTPPANRKTTYPFDRAWKVADYIFKLLQPHCEPGKIHVAGSVRRMRPDIGDIEIICIPKREILQKELWDMDTPNSGESMSPAGGGRITEPGPSSKRGGIVCRDFTEALMTITQTVLSGSVEGRMMRIITTSQNCPGIQLDIFMPQPEDYYRIYAIRTGSADYAHHVLAAAWSRKGWVGIDGTLYKKSECDCNTDAQGKNHYTINSKFKIQNSKLTRPPVWTSEGEFFTWLGLAYIDPEQREFNKHQNEAI